jgi:hypothetical protein
MIRYLPIDITIEGVGCHTGKGGGGGQIFKKKVRKERTSEVTVRPAMMFSWSACCTAGCRKRVAPGVFYV